MKNMKKTVVAFSFIIFATMIGKVLGLLRTQLIAIFYGTSMEANAFLAASNIPYQFMEFTYAAAITSVFIPIFNEIYQKDGKEGAIKYANNFINIIVCLATFVTAMGVVLTPFIIRVLLRGFSPEATQLTIDLTRIMFPMIIFTSVTYTFVGILQSFDEFNVPASISVISNLAIILYLVFFNDKFGVYGLGVMYVVGWSFQMFYQLPFVLRKGYRHSFLLDFKSEGMLKTYKLFLPILISSWVVPINSMVTNFLASYIEGGAAISILTYANQIYTIVVGVFALAISNLIFPSLSRSAAEKDNVMFKSTLRNAIRINIYILAPLMMGFIIFREQVISILYQWGAFSEEATWATAHALLFYSIGMIGFGIREILNRGFYALGDSKTPMICAVIGMSINVILSILLANFMGYGGLALANAVSVTFIGILLFFKMQKTQIDIFTKADGTFIIKVLLSSFLMGISTLFIRKILMDQLGQGKIMLLLVIGLSAVIGFAIYYLITLILSVDEAKIAIHFIKKRK